MWGKYPKNGAQGQVYMNIYIYTYIEGELGKRGPDQLSVRIMNYFF